DGARRETVGGARDGPSQRLRTGGGAGGGRCRSDRDPPGERRGRPKSRNRGGHAGRRVRPRDRRPREPTPRGGTEARSPRWHRRSSSCSDVLSPTEPAAYYRSVRRVVVHKGREQP